MSAENSSFEVTNPLQDQGLTVQKFGDADFEIQVHRLLTPAALVRAKPFLPLSAILINNSGRYIWGFTVIYTYPDRIAPVGTPWRDIISPKSDSADRSRMLSPGSAFLITPVSDFLASCDATGKPGVRPYLDGGLERIIQLFEREHLHDRLELSFDSVIFDDGVLFGPDNAKRKDALNLEAEADAEIERSLRSLSGDALKNEILAYSNLDSTSPYNLYRKSQAKFLLTVLKVRGEDGLHQLLESRQRSERFTGATLIRRGDE